MRMVRDVLSTTGITATAGIGTNMFLAKVAMDVVQEGYPEERRRIREDRRKRKKRGSSKQASHP